MHGIRALVLITSFMLFGSTVYSADWSNWRGPGQNGVSLETNLPERWSPDASKPDNNLVWRAPYGGRTTPIVQNDRVYMIGRDGEGVSEQERCLCFDANTGKLIREYRFNVFHTDIVSVRLGWTIGAGVEQKLDAHWSVKAEYLYASFARATYFTLTGLEPEKVDMSANIVRAGVNYKF